MDCDTLSVAQRAPLRAVKIGQPQVEVRQQGDILYLNPVETLRAYPQRLMERLLHWAELRGEQTFVARRGEDGQWQHISYADMLQRVRRIATWLLDQGLSAERPLLILSGNDLEHVQLASAALYAGIPYCPVSPAYSLLSQDFGKLRHIAETLQPGLVFAADATYARAIEAVFPASVSLVMGQGQVPGRASTAFDDVLATVAEPRADQAFAALRPQSLAKFLFTSGSTKLPKGVITTQGMLCANQQMLLQTFPEFAETPPVLVDWLPWNHTFGGSHNVGIVLYNGGSLYIDDGKPTPQGFAQTLHNLKDISPTAYLTVPKGWEELVKALEQDSTLCERFFSRMKLFFFAGAGLSQAIWDRLDAVAVAHCGERIRMMAGLGMTETSPSCTFTTGPLSVAGYIGLPAPGCEVKLVPVDGKLEARFRGPHVMPGYWRAPEQTQQAFDDEGFYRSGDAVRLCAPDNPQLGLMFDGRIAEDFKLSSGVFISVGPMRTKVILQGAPYVLDVVVLGPDRPCLGVLIFPRMPECRQLSGLGAQASDSEVLASPALRDWLASLLATLNRDATGNASHIQFASLAGEAPSIDLGEVTDKGSINQRTVLQLRHDLIESLYAGPGALRVDAP
ncbi:Long-chain-fatty-acid-CoA ligase ACSBG2 [Pseudomonas reidholzensis]|uniref:Long-chain-fatty-acid-CoA ligase ACSBG2 n=1 Tax=Pseudomonas reidholzensis TaxID=1785162 RepID=A0A383RT24_9PSED|nr:feruloyl-CoA synthase [Pseudomonas reidholzensis]SYX90227.1 Long-chain-fatty-acid-CoA ligase ACSBG2 [Pseudomonas reidholzensis]